MKCYECKHFKILQQPLKSCGITWDLGTANCNKYNLIVDFRTESKLKKLECVEGKAQ